MKDLESQVRSPEQSKLAGETLDAGLKTYRVTG